MPELEGHLDALEAAARAPAEAVQDAGRAYRQLTEARAAELEELGSGEEHGEPFPPAAEAAAAESGTAP